MVMKGKSNPVAKYLRTFNKATVQRDRKKDAKKGASKYKKDIYKEEGDLEKARDNVGSDSRQLVPRRKVASWFLIARKNLSVKAQINSYHPMFVVI